jgi:membrane protein required for colicin V production
MSFAFIDVFFGVVIFFFAINAAVKGFVHELFTKAAFFLGIFCALMFRDRLSPYLEPYLKNQLFSQIAAFALIFIVVYLILRLIQHLVSKLFESDIMSGLNKALGFFFGAAEGLIIVSLLLFILHSQPWINVDSLLNDSFFERIFGGLAAAQRPSIGGIIPALR